MSPQNPESPIEKSMSNNVDTPAGEVEKSYGFVPLSNQGKDILEIAGHHLFHGNLISGKLSLSFTVRTPSYISSGVFALGSEPSENVRLIKTAVQSNQKLIIPGSSLKGAIRCAFEAITRSCLCKTKVHRDKVPQGYSECKIQRERTNVCPACQLFGAMGWQGLISFTDATGTETTSETKFIPTLYPPQEKSDSYYNDDGLIQGRKFYFHATEAADLSSPPSDNGNDTQMASKGYIFETNLHLKNISQAQIGALFIIFGQDVKYPLYLKVGGGKPIGMGTMSTTVEALHISTNLKERYTNYRCIDTDSITGKKLKSYIKSSIAAAHENLVEKSQLESLAEILKWPPKKSAT